MPTSKEQALRLSLALKGAKSGLWEWNVRDNSTYFDANFFLMAGYEPDEFQHTYTEWKKRVHPEEIAAVEKAVQQYLSGESASYSVEYRFKTKTDGWIWILDQGEIVERDQDGNPVRMIGLHTDISRLKQTEKKLLESESRYRSLFNNSHSVMLLIDPKTASIVDVNSSACTYYGYDRETLLQMKITDINQLSEQQVVKEMDHAKKEERSHFHFNHRLANGETRDVDVFSGPIQAQGKQLLYSIVYDTTERNLAEREVKEREAFLQSVFRATPTGIGIIVDRVLIKVNVKMCEMMGYSEEELIGQKSRMLYVNDADFEYVGREKYRQISEHGTGTVETRLKCKDGHIIDVLVSSTPIDLGDLSKGVTFTVLDITERVQAVKSLREVAEKYRTLAEDAPDLLYRLDLEGEIVFVSQSVFKLTGYTVEEAIGKKITEVYANPTDRNPFLATLQKDGKVDDFIVELKRKDGSTLWASINAQFYKDNDGNNLGIDGVVRDITAQKKAQMLLQQSEQRLQLAIEGADIGLWDWNMRTDDVYYSPSYLSMLGYGPTELPHTATTFENLLHSEDRELVKQRILASIEQGSGEWNEEFRLRAKNGQYLWISGRGKVVEYSKNGIPLRAAGTHLDITSRKLADEELKDRERRFRELFNNMSSGVAIYEAVDDGKDFIIKDLNRAALLSSQVELHMVAGKRVTEVFPDIDRMGLFEVLQRVFKTGIPEHSPASFYQDGRLSLWVENYICKIPSGEIVAIYDDISDRKKLEEKLINSKEEWERTFDAIPDIVTIQDKDLRIVRANQAAAVSFELECEELIGRKCYEVFRGTQEPCPGCPGVVSLADINSHEEVIEHKSLKKSFQVSSSPLLDDNNEVQFLVHVARDITDRLKLEENLLQAQKMEAIGTLAGGIAHDFNNILSAIIGYSEIARRGLPPDSKAVNDINKVIMAGSRAADLVKQILTFSRKDRAEIEMFQPHLIVEEVLKMLRSSLPTTVGIVTDLDADCGYIEASTTRLHQLAMNLCTNAVHAMVNEKGTLRIGLQRKDVSAREITEPDVQPGPYVVLSVADDGCGMDADILARIFEPYYTTKGVDSGTGLGLAVVHGIVHESKGFLQVESQPGVGSTFYAYFPAKEPDEEPLSEDVQSDKTPTGTERVLVVDDEISIISIIRSLLEELGYQITTELSSKRALEIIRSDPQSLDLLITDQTMPDLTGMELSQEALKIRPDLPIILCSGYNSMLSEGNVRGMGIREFCMKPMTMEQLAMVVRRVLDEGGKPT